MLALHPAHRARGCAHHHALGRHDTLAIGAADALHPIEQRTVGHAGGSEDAVALGEVFEAGEGPALEAAIRRAAKGARNERERVRDDVVIGAVGILRRDAVATIALFSSAMY